MHLHFGSAENISRIFSLILQYHQKKIAVHFFGLIRTSILRFVFLIAGFLLFSTSIFAQTFEGQIVQVCDGSGGTTTIFATAESAPSGDWELGIFNEAPLGTGSNSEYIEVTGVSPGTALEIRDAAAPSTSKAQLINSNSTFYTTSNAADGSCSEQLSCSTESLYDIGESNFAGPFSNNNVNGIIGANSLDGPHDINFNAVIFGDFSTDGTGDTEGRLAVQNDFTSTSGSGYTVGGGAPASTGGLHAPFGWDNLVVGGDLDFDGGGVRGNVLYNTATNLPGFIGLAVSGMYRRATPDIDWNGSLSDLKTLSTNINPTNISVAHNLGTVSGSATLTLDGNNNSGLVVFNIPSFSSGGSFNFINVGNADAILINVGGSSVSFSGGSIALDGTILNFPFNAGSAGKELIEKTIWNFYESTSFTLNAYLLIGSVLAPYTSATTLSGGNINGQSVFAGNVQQNNGFEFHNFCFIGSNYLPETFTLTFGPCWRTLSSPIQD
ncbi:MAG: choice-of-anchor A family protein [Bacteroidetes bacterium]|jgi:choice-of-anchor A domain-containing protein|nr:choice-of-anchor A family protein [Bacteroidota bacterium]